MVEVVFDHFEDTLDVLNPLKGFENETQRIEVRRDPLLGHTSIFNPLIEQGLKVFIGDADRGLIESMAADSAGRCFFCPGNIGGLARFPPGIVPEGTIRVGEALLFPNLFALGKYHAVAIVSRVHYLELSEFTPELIADALRAMHRLVTAVYRQDGSPLHLTVNANYLFPAGASLMHPHFQLLITSRPYTGQARLLAACAEYFTRHGTPYHRDLIDTECTRGERYIARTGAWHWLCAYAPSGSNEVLGVHAAHADFGLLTEEDLLSLARGLSAVLRLYQSLGHLSFNFTLYARRDAPKADGFNMLIRCITRQNPYPNYRADDFFLQKGLQTELILHPPEALAVKARANFAG